MPHHIGFEITDLENKKPEIALLSGEPERTGKIANTYLQNVKLLSKYRGLHSYLGDLTQNQSILVATSGMGASSTSIIVNELIQIGIKKIIRIGTCGSIQSHVKVGNLVISQAALCRQGAANDIAPIEYPAVADPFLTIGLVETAKNLGFNYHLGITASVDTFYEGQERITSSANRNLQSHLVGITEQYRNLNILNYEMESGTLFKMAGVYDFKAACICAVVAQRNNQEDIAIADKDLAVSRAIEVVIKTALREI